MGIFRRKSKEAKALEEEAKKATAAAAERPKSQPKSAQSKGGSAPTGIATPSLDQQVAEAERELQKTMGMGSANNGAMLADTLTATGLSSQVTGGRADGVPSGLPPPPGQVGAAGAAAGDGRRVDVHVLSAKNLKVADIVSRSSDPFVVLGCGRQQFKTNHLTKTTNPVWNEFFSFKDIVFPENKFLEMEVMDWDSLTKADSLGQCKVDISSLQWNKPTDVTLPLEGVKQGEIRVIVTPRDPSMLDAAKVKEQTKEASKGKVQGTVKVKLLQGRDLVKMDKGLHKSDPYVIFRLGANGARSRTIQQNLNPVWDDEEFEFDVFDFANDIVQVECWDEDQGGKDEPDAMGNAAFAVKDLSSSPTDVWLKLHNVKSGELRVVAQFIAKDKHPFDHAPGYVRVTVVEGKNIPPNPRTGSINAYVVGKLDDQAHRTRTIVNDTNPVWNATLDYKVKGLLGEVLVLELRDQEAQNAKPDDNIVSKLSILLPEVVPAKMGETAGKSLPLPNLPGGAINIQFCFVERLPDSSIQQPEIATPNVLARQNSRPAELQLGLFIWGDGSFGQLGDGGEKHTWKPKLVSDLAGLRVKDVVCRQHVLMLTEDSQLFSWGNSETGQLGLGSLKRQSYPQRVRLPQSVVSGIRQVSVGWKHSAFVTDDGGLFTWGSSESGQLGHGYRNMLELSPSQVMSVRPRKIVRVACGYKHTAALTDEGEVLTWGEGEYGQLGNGDVDRQRVVSIPTEVAELKARRKRIVMVCCGGNHTIAVSDSGEVYTWGSGSFGQLGHADKLSQSTPRIVMGLRAKNVRLITAGWRHTAALTSVGEVATWGGNQYGELGHGDDVDCKEPKVVKALQQYRIVQIASGDFHMAALSDRFEMFTWGCGNSGELGHNGFSGHRVPKLVGSLMARQVFSIAAGGSNTIALTKFIEMEDVGEDYVDKSTLPLEDEDENEEMVDLKLEMIGLELSNLYDFDMRNIENDFQRLNNMSAINSVTTDMGGHTAFSEGLSGPSFTSNASGSLPNLKSLTISRRGMGSPANAAELARQLEEAKVLETRVNQERQVLEGQISRVRLQLQEAEIERSLVLQRSKNKGKTQHDQHLQKLLAQVRDGELALRLKDMERELYHSKVETFECLIQEAREKQKLIERSQNLENQLRSHPLPMDALSAVTGNSRVIAASPSLGYGDVTNASSSFGPTSAPLSSDDVTREDVHAVVRHINSLEGDLGEIENRLRTASSPQQSQELQVHKKLKEMEVDAARHNKRRLETALKAAEDKLSMTRELAEYKRQAEEARNDKIEIMNQMKHGQLEASEKLRLAGVTSEQEVSAVGAHEVDTKKMEDLKKGLEDSYRSLQQTQGRLDHLTQQKAMFEKELGDENNTSASSNGSQRRGSLFNRRGSKARKELEAEKQKHLASRKQLEELDRQHKLVDMEQKVAQSQVDKYESLIRSENETQQIRRASATFLASPMQQPQQQ